MTASGLLNNQSRGMLLCSGGSTVRSSDNMLVVLATKVDRTLFGETVEFVEYGNRQGHTVIYFHGAPARQKKLLFSQIRLNVNIVCWQRFSIDESLTGADYFQHMADEIQTIID